MKKCMVKCLSMILVLTLLFSGCAVRIKTIHGDEIPNICVGETHQLACSVEPENAADKTLAYKSSDESVLTIDNEGVASGVKTGEAVVTAESVNGIAAECKILVKEYATDVKLENDSISIASGSSKNIKASLIPDNSDGEITYSSSDNSVVTVDKNGKLSAKSNGNATITVTVTTEDGNSFAKKCTVKVSAKKSSSSSSSSSNSNSPNNKKSHFTDEQIKTMTSKPWLDWCPFCSGNGYTASGNPCDQCDYWKNHNH